MDIKERLFTFLFSVFLSFVSGGLAWRFGFFKPLGPISTHVKGSTVLQGFLYFIIVQVIILPIVVVMIAFFSGFDYSHFALNAVQKGWLNILLIVAGFWVVFAVFFSLPPWQRKEIWGDTKKWYYHILIGITAWFISFPMVTAVDQLTALTIYLLTGREPIEQNVVQHFRGLTEHPKLFWTLGIAIVTLVPAIEELLFRGFLQSWLLTKLKTPKKAIALTSLIFALFHFSAAQGITNIEIFISLFILSCFLGYVYLRQRSLWASIGLHGFFNFMTLMFLLFSDNADL